MITVASISPKMISTVCALRRGMLRRPIRNIVRLRHAMNATDDRQSAVMMTSATMIFCIGMPNIFDTGGSVSAIGYQLSAIEDRRSAQHSREDGIGPVGCGGRVGPRLLAEHVFPDD